MNIENLYNSLDSKLEPVTNRQELINFLKKNIDALPDSKSQRQTLVYNIAGLLSTKFAKSLDKDDSLDIILTLAGELEIHSDDNTNKWVEIYNLIQEL
jgi:hypothetical protein